MAGVWCVIGGETMIIYVSLTYQIWYIHHLALLLQCISIYGPAWTSLDQFIIWWRLEMSSLFKKQRWWLSMYRVWFGVKPWLMACSTPVRYEPCAIQPSHNSGIEYLDMYDLPWTTPPPGGCAVFKIYPISEHVRGVFKGGTMILDVFITYQTWSIYP